MYGQAPVANFTASLTTGCAPVIVNFQNTSTGNPTSYLWDFGNGNTSTLANPIATYLNPGSYTVKLTVTNASGSNALVRNQYINIFAAPTVDFQADFRSGCYPLSVQFIESSTPAAGTVNTAWAWDFGNGQTSTQQNPQVTFNSVGNFTTSLKVTNDKGCSLTISRPITSPPRQASTHPSPTPYPRSAPHRQASRLPTRPPAHPHSPISGCLEMDSPPMLPVLPTSSIPTAPIPPP